MIGSGHIETIHCEANTISYETTRSSNTPSAAFLERQAVGLTRQTKGDK